MSTILPGVTGRRSDPSSASAKSVRNRGPPVDQPHWLELKRKISVKQAAQLNDVSEDTFRRRYSHLIKKISPRRCVVELGDALAIGNQTAPEAAHSSGAA